MARKPQFNPFHNRIATLESEIRTLKWRLRDIERAIGEKTKTPVTDVIEITVKSVRTP